MATCFTAIRGRRMRVTKVNALGRPVFGPNAFVATSGFVSVQFSPEIEEGEETTVKTASGDICVSEKACDALKWITVQMEFCQVDPCLFTLINETWQELRDCVGEVIGWAESHKFSCDTGFALELWTDVTGYTPTIPGATGAFGYMLLPFVIGGTLGEQTVENGAVSFTITGRTKKGSGWGVGPYDVMCNDASTGACGPLLTPVGPDEPRRILLTTCPPPPAVCGCQPLSSPDGPQFTVTEVAPPAGQPRRVVQVEIPAGTPGSYRLSWGDQSPPIDIVPGTPVTHTYGADGTFNISVWDATNNQKVTVKTVTVPFEGAIAPKFTVVQEGANTRAARVTVTNPSAGRAYQVEWEAGSGFVDLPTTGTPPHSLAHTYTSADGDKVITVRDKAVPTTLTSRTIKIPLPAAVVPTLMVTEDIDTVDPRNQVRATITNAVDGRTYEVLFEGTAWQEMPTTGFWENSATFLYPTAGAKTVQVRDLDDPTKSAQQNVQVPFTGPQFTVAKGATDMEAAVTVSGAGSYEAEWTSGTWTALAGGTGTHTYGAAGTYQVRVRETTTPTVISSKQVRVPFPVTLGAEAVPDGMQSEPADAPTEPAIAESATTTRKRAK